MIGPMLNLIKVILSDSSVPRNRSIGWSINHRWLSIGAESCSMILHHWFYIIFFTYFNNIILLLIWLSWVWILRSQVRFLWNVSLTKGFPVAWIHFIEIISHCWWDVVEVDIDMLIAIRSHLFMPESQRMHNLNQNYKIGLTQSNYGLL